MRRASAALLLALTVTALERRRGAWEVTFNDAFTVSGVEAGKEGVALPLSGSREREYADLRILSEDLYRELRESIEDGRAPERRFGARVDKTPPFRVLDASAYEERELPGPRRAGRVDVIFDAGLSVRFGVLSDGKKTWVAAPARKGWRKWKAQFTILDEAYRARVEHAVLEAWRAAAASK